MADLWGRPAVYLKIGVEFSEDEARALYQITRYDVEAFLKVFYEKMGKAYLEKHEQGLRSLFRSFPKAVSVWLDRADVARKAFEETE